MDFIITEGQPDRDITPEARALMLQVQSAELTDLGVDIARVNVAGVYEALTWALDEIGQLRDDLGRAQRALDGIGEEYNAEVEALTRELLSTADEREFELEFA